MTHGQPSVSVVIPCFNNERYVGAAIESVLSQTFPPPEAIVIDDGSTDSSAAVVARFPSVTLMRQENAGAGAARNAGIARAVGEFIALLDADDLWAPTKLEVQVAALAADREAAGAFCYAEQFISPDLSESDARRLRFDPSPVPGIFPSAFVFRRDVFERVGSFAPDLRLGEFIDWHGRAVDLGLRFVTLTDVLVRRRIHLNNTGRREQANRADYLQGARAALARRRGAE